MLSHHVVIRDGKIANYHPYPPTPWNASPRDEYGTPGAYEDAVQNTPIFEENGPDKFKGIDVMRAVRSFDPCLPCGVHMYTARARLSRFDTCRCSERSMAESAPFRTAVQDKQDFPRAQTMKIDESFSTRMARIETLIQRIEQSADAAALETTREIVSTVLELHGAGLQRILELLARANSGSREALDSFLEDDLVRSLLLLHDPHPENLDRRIRDALDGVRPYLHSHGGDVELLEVSPSAVRLRMDGSCHGCPSSSATLRDTIERAIREVAPDAPALEVQGLEPEVESDVVQIQMPQPKGGSSPRHTPGFTSQLAAQES